MSRLVRHVDFQAEAEERVRNRYEDTARNPVREFASCVLAVPA
jgi:hypothetical protein